jgi:hypothetical protein
MIEQAGDDRVLFMNTKPQEYIDMKFPEYVLSATRVFSKVAIKIPQMRFKAHVFGEEPRLRGKLT